MKKCFSITGSGSYTSRTNDSVDIVTAHISGDGMCHEIMCFVNKLTLAERVAHLNSFQVATYDTNMQHQKIISFKK